MLIFLFFYYDIRFIISVLPCLLFANKIVCASQRFLLLLHLTIITIYSLFHNLIIFIYSLCHSAIVPICSLFRPSMIDIYSLFHIPMLLPFIHCSIHLTHYSYSIPFYLIRHPYISLVGRLIFHHISVNF